MPSCGLVLYAITSVEGHCVTLQEVNEVRVKAQGSLASVEEEKARLTREVSTASQQLSEERNNTERLMVTRTELEVWRLVLGV